MESNDSYPVFHTRLARTQRRRLTRPDGTSAGWLIVTGDEVFIENTTEPADRDDPPQLAVSSQR